MTEQAVIFKDVEDTTHLAEDQNTGPFGPHIPEQFIENDHLSWILDKMFISGVRRARFLVIHS